MTHDTQEGHKGFYRARDGVIFGVCKGIADSLDVSLFWTRVIVVAATIFTGLWPVPVLYLVAALIMKPEPVVPFKNDDEAEFYNSYTTSRSAALQRLKRTYDNLERRIRRIEDIVTNREYDWERRLSE